MDAEHLVACHFPREYAIDLSLPRSLHNAGVRDNMREQQAGPSVDNYFARLLTRRSIVQMLSIITTCKNRLQHLKQTLPLMLKQSMAEVIVVDYGCEQGTTDWVNEHHPAAKVVQVNDDPIFCVARARNIGAKNSSRSFFCFADADVMIHEQLGEWLWLHKDPKKFYLYPTEVANENELTGFSIVAKDHFLKIGGFDEAFKGWGGEDNDLYERLNRIGLTEGSIPRNSISAISHDSTLRQLREGSGGYETVPEALSMNHLYRLIKRDIWHITKSDIDLENRKQLFQHIKSKNEEAKLKKQDFFEVSVNVPVDAKSNRYPRSLRKLSYKTPVHRPT